MEEQTIYPGHPVVLGLQIMLAFPSFEAALSKGRQYPAALESGAVDGAGGAVYAALHVLEQAAKGKVSPEGAFEFAKSRWADHRTEDFSDRLQPGQEQAERMKEDFIRTLTAWMAKPEPEEAAALKM